MNNSDNNNNRAQLPSNIVVVGGTTTTETTTAQSSFSSETIGESTLSELQEEDDDNASSEDEDEYEYEHEYEEEESNRTEYDHEVVSEYQNSEVFGDGCGNNPTSPLLSDNDIKDWNEKCGKLTREQMSFFTNSQSDHSITFCVEDMDIDDDPALFLYFLQQYCNHDQEEKNAKDLLQVAIEQGIESQLPSIIDANEQLIQSRRVLKNAYVFKYLHLEDYERTLENCCIFQHLPQKEFSSYMDDIHFQFHQYLEMLERFTNELASLLSQPSFINMNNQDLNDKMMVVRNAEKNLINHVLENM